MIKIRKFSLDIHALTSLLCITIHVFVNLLFRPHKRKAEFPEIYFVVATRCCSANIAMEAVITDYFVQSDN